MTESGKTRYFSRWAGLAVASALLLALLAGVTRWQRVWLAQRLRDHLAGAADQEVSARLEQLAGLDDAGLPILVEALHHERRTVREAAERILNAKLQDWRRLPAERSAPHVLALVQRLAERAKSASPEMLRASSDLALQSLSWPSLGNGIDGTALRFSCEQVLLAARRAGVISEPGDSVDSPEGSIPSHVVASTGDTRSLGAPPLISPPQPPADIPRLDPSSVRDETPAPSERNRRDAIQPPRELASPMMSELIALTDAEVIYRVSDPLEGSAAENELRRRGFSRLDVRLARAASDPDPGRREELARSLPQLAGVDTRSWLLLLLHDESPRVRAAAVRWLATTVDPDLHEQLRDLALHETDETVRQALRSVDALKRQ